MYNVFWCHGCYCFRAGFEANLNKCHWKPRKVIQSYNFSWHLEKIPNCVPLNSIWQLAGLDRRKRITVWNELHATLTYRGSLESEQDDSTRQFRWLHLGLGYSDYSASSCTGLTTAIIHRVQHVRGHHYRLSAELPPAPISACTILSISLVCRARARPATENSLIPTCHRNRY